jgi:gamma-glutamyltranspeptidase/glutathione hydrolase
MRRAYLDRARFLGDPDFVQVPLAKLLSKDLRAELAGSIKPSKASSSAELGKESSPAARRSPTRRRTSR